MIADKNGVDVFIGEGPVITGLDFNFAQQKVDEIEQRCKAWDMNLHEGHHMVGRVVFRAYQFIADGVERRTIALVYVQLESKHRGKGMSYIVAQYIIDTVTRECDQLWGSVEGKPVLFVESRDLKGVADKISIISFLKKIGERALGIKPVRPVPDQEITLTVMGEDVSIQLIQGHLLRSAAA